MAKRRKQGEYTIPVPGESVPVSKPVFDAWKHFENKEEYFMVTQKGETFHYDPEKLIAEFLPSREDSLNRLVADGMEFAVDQSSVEDRAIAAVMVEHLMEQLSPQERNALYQRFCLGKTLNDCAAALGFSGTAFKRYMRTLVTKCREILENGRK